MRVRGDTYSIPVFNDRWLSVDSSVTRYIHLKIQILDTAMAYLMACHAGGMFCVEAWPGQQYDIVATSIYVTSSKCTVYCLLVPAYTSGIMMSFATQARAESKTSNCHHDGAITMIYLLSTRIKYSIYESQHWSLKPVSKKQQIRGKQIRIYVYRTFCI